MFKAKVLLPSFLGAVIGIALVGCGSDSVNDSVIIVANEPGTTTCDIPATKLSSAYLGFVAAPNVTVVLSDDGCTVTLESAGKPDHTSSYWDSGNDSGLYVEPQDADLFNAQRSPGDIEDYTNDSDLSVSVSPELATNYSLAKNAYFASEDLGNIQNTNDFLHTESILLIDENKHICDIYNGLNSASMSYLVNDIETLKAL